MDPTELGRWTRFAAKGGIGKCTAVQDCVAESPDDLMFIQGDEIVVLMHLHDQHDIYMGYCEGVVGRFEGSHVKFHSKLKRPIAAKRSSSTSSPASSSRPSSKSPAPSPQTAPAPLSNNETSQRRSLFTPVEPDNPTLTARPSDSTVFNGNSLAPKPDICSLSSSTADSVLATSADPGPQLETDLCSPNQSFDVSDQSLLYPSHDIPDNSFASEPSTRFSVATYDGMEGIGLSLLQDFMGGSGDDTSSETSSRSDGQTPEPRPPNSPESTINIHGLADEATPTKPPPLTPVMGVPSDPSETSSQLSSNPSEHSEYNGEEWEGASDIYDNYRYSRFSMASKMSRYSKGSMQTPPPIPVDHRRPSLDSIASAVRRPAPLDLPDLSPLLRTRFGSPSPTSISATSPTSAPLSSDAGAPVLRERPENQRSPARLIELQARLTPEREAQIIVQDDESDPANNDIPSSSTINGGQTEPVSPPSSYESHESLIEEKKRTKSTTSTFVVMNHPSPPLYSPSEEALTSQHQHLSPTQNATSIPSSGQQDFESLPPARPRPQVQGKPRSDFDFGSSRTSMFLPHPGAPKAPGSAPSGPLYGRVHQSQFHLPPSHEITMGSPSLFQMLRMAGTVQYYPNGTPRQTTVYGKCETDLATSICPVPISWSLEPFMSVPANRIPARSQTSPHINQLRLPPSQDPLRPSSHKEIGEVSRPNSNVISTSSTINSTSKASFSPLPPESRRRSRSFSGFGSSLEFTETNERDTSAISPSMKSGTRSSEDSGFGSRPSDPRNPPSISRAHQPSPLSLPQNTIKSLPSPVSPKPRLSSLPSRTSASSSPIALTSAVSPSMSTLGLNGSSHQSLRQAVSNVSLRTSSKMSTTSTSSPVASRSSQFTPRPIMIKPLSISGDSTTSVFTRNESPSSPLSPTSPQMVDYPMDEPRPSMSSSSGHSLSHIPRSVTKLTESTSAPNTANVRDSVDTDISRYSDTLPSPLISPSSTLPPSTSAPPATPSALTRNLSLRSKISLSAIRAKTGVPWVSSQDDVMSPSTPINGEVYDLETVQVEDMDFELVKPNLLRAPSPQPSLDSLGGKARDIASLYSPVKPDGASFLQTESPTMSMTSPAISDSEVSLPFNNSSIALPASIISELNNPNARSRQEMEAHRHRELKWVSLMSSLPPAQAKKSKKVKKLLLEGVPASVRYQVWAHLADCQAKRMNGLYSKLTKRGKVPVSSTVERDVAEYFGDQPQSKDGSVVCVLQAYLNMVPDIQYNRGLACIVGQLLAQAPEEDAFWIFISMMDSYLRPYFASNPVQIEVDASLFAKAVEVNDPALAKKVFLDMGIHPSQICKLWFSSLFFDALPQGYLLRVWDVFLFEGIPFLFRIGLALFSCCRRAFLESQGQGRAMAIITRIPLPCLPPNPDALIESAMSMKLKDDDVRKHRTRMEAQLKRQTQSRVIKSTTVGGIAAISLPKS